MFVLAFSIGIFSYIIFLLGIIGVLFYPFVIALTLLYWGAFIFIYRNRFLIFFKEFRFQRYSLFFLLCVLIIFIQALVNLIGVLGPEIGFDALWYHLTLPKLYLQYHTIFHVPGGTLLYSDMPKLTEMLYVSGLSFGSSIFPKFIHFLFGILCCIALYKVARRYFTPTIAIIAPVIFYSSLVVGWESVTAYIDLSRTFFEIMTLWSFLNWTKSKKQEDLIKTGLLSGLTFATKTLAFGNVIIYAFMFLIFDFKTLPFVKTFKRTFIFVCLAFLIPLPWFVFSYVHTGNPFYPIFSPFLSVGRLNFFQTLNPLHFINSIWSTFVISADPINPIYLISIPFIFIHWKSLRREIPEILILSLVSFLTWYVTPQMGGGRFILAFLPIFTILVVYLLTILSESWRKIFILSILFLSIVSIGYRLIANYKFVPVILGSETKANFLSKNLAFNLGDFYDIDGYFAKNIKSNEKVLLYGFHNLYYVDFPYIDSSWVQKGDIINYVAVLNSQKPERFAYWNLIYFNKTTGVSLYQAPEGLWRY
ncbi:MAG TPA: glycosyltransferase family 39 protein [Patescibacteria group bacterium]